MATIRNDRLNNVCKPGKGPFTCSYLGMGEQGLECLKSTEFQKAIDHMRAAKSMVAMGDNCSGPPEFRLTQETLN